MPDAAGGGIPQVDEQDQGPFDLANHVAETVKKRARPWRAIIALVLALAAAVASSVAGSRFHDLISPGFLVAKIVTASTAAAFCLFAVVAVVGLADKARKALEPKAGTGHAAIVRYTILLIGGVFTLVGALALFKIPVGQLVVGGALTTILIGIAAQQSLSNVFAGIVLLLSRPFTVGDDIMLRSGALSGPIQGSVIGIGITYVTLDTPDGVLQLPNSQVLAAGVGRLRTVAAPAPVPADTVLQAPQDRGTQELPRGDGGATDLAGPAGP
jgi:small-conductance mechanosensitive channel